MISRYHISYSWHDLGYENLRLTASNFVDGFRRCIPWFSVTKDNKSWWMNFYATILRSSRPLFLWVEVVRLGLGLVKPPPSPKNNLGEGKEEGGRGGVKLVKKFIHQELLSFITFDSLRTAH